MRFPRLATAVGLVAAAGITAAGVLALRPAAAPDVAAPPTPSSAPPSRPPPQDLADVSRAHDGGADTVAASAKAEPSTAAVAGSSAAELDLVLITLDTTRADRLGCYGSKSVQTPSLDRIAARGVLFENAVSPVPLTLPAHCSLLTGLLPGAHAVRDNRGFRLAPEKVTLAEALQARGVRTGGFVSSYVLDRRWGIAQGFDRYFDDFKVPRDRPVNMEDIQRRGDETVREALAWIAQAGSRRFFTWIHLYDPHPPYDPPAPFAARYAGRPYDGEIAWTDSLVGRVLDGLEKMGLTRRTIFAVIADHGESLGEHGERGHGFFLYEATTRVPFLLAGPPTLAPRRIREVVTAVDLAPTLLDLMGVDPRAALPRIQGVSLVPMLGRSGRLVAGSARKSSRSEGAANPVSRGDTPGGNPDDKDGSEDGRSGATRLPGGQLPAEAYSETYYARFHYGWSELRAVRSDRWHFIEAPRPELYDLASDPGEMRNRAASEPAVLGRMREALAKIERGSGSAGPTPVPGEEDQETLDKLAALGYAGGAAAPAPTRVWKDLPDPKDRIKVYNLMVRAGEESAAGAPDKAIATLREVLAADPEVIDAWFLLAGACAARRDWAAAEEAYRKALAKRPDHTSAVLGLADMLASNGRTEDAIRECQRFLRVKPGTALVHHSLGRLLLQAGRLDVAEQEFLTALRLAPDLAESAYDLGVVRESRSDFPAAESWFRKAITIDPSYAAAHAALARRRHAAGDFEGAASEMRAAVALDPSNGVYRKALADVQKRTRE